MKKKMLSMMETTKKKAGAVVLCGVLVAAIGTGAAFASNSMTSLQVKMENGVRSYSTDGGSNWSETAPASVEEPGNLPEDADANSFIVRIENGVKLYSTDGGKTWSKTAPTGVTETTDKDGKVTFVSGNQPKEGEGKGLLSKVENGVRSYSTDGGLTWSEKAPAGAEGSE